MKQRMTILCLAVWMTALLVACQGGNTNRGAGESAAQNATSSPGSKVDRQVVVDEIREVLAQHDKALNEKNIDALMATYSSDPNTVLLGTGAGERWVGPEQIKTAYTQIFKDYDPGTLEVNCDWKTGGADDAGTVAWLAATCPAKDSAKGKPREYTLNVSGAVKKEAGKWRFVMLHMSNAVEPPASK